MMTPITTELPLHLEPTTADPFLGRPPIDDFDVSPATELHSRRSDGISVRLLWYRSHDRLVVAVSDAATGDAFELAVHPAQGLDAFHHPYARSRSRHPVPLRPARPLTPETASAPPQPASYASHVRSNRPVESVRIDRVQPSGRNRRYSAKHRISPYRGNWTPRGQLDPGSPTYALGEQRHLQEI
jgi:hypothetical protein